MFSKYSKRTFSIGGEINSAQKKKNLPLEERVRFTSLSSFDSRRARKRGYFLMILLFAVLATIFYLGLPSREIPDDKIDDLDIEKVG